MKSNNTYCDFDCPWQKVILSFNEMVGYCEYYKTELKKPLFVPDEYGLFFRCIKGKEEEDNGRITHMAINSSGR